jgi:hypothetical protein
MSGSAKGESMKKIISLSGTILLLAAVGLTSSAVTAVSAAPVSAVRPATQGKPLDKAAADALVAELKEGLADLIEDEEAVAAIVKKWDAHNLAGKTRTQILNLFFADVKSVVADKETLDSVWEAWKEVGSDASEDQGEPEVPKPATPAPQGAGNKPAQNTPAKPAETLLTVDQILDKYVQAIGGKVAILKFNSTVSKGTCETPATGASGPIEIYAKAPNKWVFIITIPGIGAIMEGYDGATGWSQDPTTGLREKSGVELAGIKRDLDYYREIKLKDLYTKMEVRGKEKVGDREAYVVLATPAEGAPYTYYFDAQTGLKVRLDELAETGLGQIPLVSYFEDYRDVDGVKVPFLVRRHSSVLAYTFKLDEVKHNVPIEDAKFAKPAAQ